MGLKLFKSQHRPAACTRNPLEHLLKDPNLKFIFQKISQESIELYGKDLLAECDKRLVCLGLNCLGRSLPVESPTAKPLIEQLAKTHRIEDGKLFIDANCSRCPISKSCTSLCAQNADFINRDRLQAPNIQFQPSMDITPPTEAAPIGVLFENENAPVPWDILTPKKQQLVKSYVYERKDFAQTAKQCGIKSPSQCRYMFYSALTAMSEAAAMRNLLNSQSDLTAADKELLENLYIHNYTVSQCAAKQGVTKQAVSAHKQRLINRYKVKWLVFVRKVGKKVVYNVPQVLK